MRCVPATAAPPVPQAFGPYIMSMKPCEGLTDEHIRTAIDNAKGPRSALFIPEQAFEMLVRQQVSRLEEPCLKCCDHVFDELVKICEQAEKELIQYPQLRTRVNEQVQGGWGSRVFTFGGGGEGR